MTTRRISINPANSVQSLRLPDGRYFCKSARFVSDFTRGGTFPAQTAAFFEWQDAEGDVYEQNYGIGDKQRIWPDPDDDQFLAGNAELSKQCNFHHLQDRALKDAGMPLSRIENPDRSPKPLFEAWQGIWCDLVYIVPEGQAKTRTNTKTGQTEDVRGIPVPRKMYFDQQPAQAVTTPAPNPMPAPAPAPAEAVPDTGPTTIPSPSPAPAPTSASAPAPMASPSPAFPAFTEALSAGPPTNFVPTPAGAPSVVFTAPAPETAGHTETPWDAPAVQPPAPATAGVVVNQDGSPVVQPTVFPAEARIETFTSAFHDAVAAHFPEMVAIAREMIADPSHNDNSRHNLTALIYNKLEGDQDLKVDAMNAVRGPEFAAFLEENGLKLEGEVISWSEDRPF